LGGGVYFDRGIDSITFTGGSPTARLPDKKELTPAENLQRPQLDRLLSRPNLDSFLEQVTLPEITDRDLLMPSRFKLTMEEVAALINEAAAQPHDDPQATRTLNRASRLLAEEKDLRDLLQMYRSVLFQG
jgi:type III secretion protein X